MTEAAPTYTTLTRLNRCIAGMIEDPELTGDLLLVGIAMARHVHLVGGSGKLAEVCATLYDKPELSYRVDKALRDDIRRYNPALDLGRKRAASATCCAPMVRRAGECGRPASSMGSYRDLDTGRAVALDACSRTEHRQWWNQAHRARHWAAAEAEKAGTLPTPPANAGGVLARHLPRIDWPALWRWYDKKWTAPPEETPAGDARPELILMVTETPETTPHVDVRPALAAVPQRGASR